MQPRVLEAVPSLKNTHVFPPLGKGLEGASDIPTHDSGKHSDMQKLQEQIEILKEDNKVIRHSFWVSSQENRALLGEIARLEGLVKLKDNVIDTWLKGGKVWDEERAKFIGNASDVSRQFGEETQKYENQSSRMEKSRTLSSKHDSSDSEMEVSTLVWGSPLRTSTFSTASNEIQDTASTNQLDDPNETNATTTANHDRRQSLSSAEMYTPVEAQCSPLEATITPIRRRGRPKGSKNKKGTLATLLPASDIPKRKRGRPRKEQKPEILGPDGLSLPKRKRGRPYKYPKPESYKQVDRVPEDDQLPAQGSTVNHASTIRPPSNSGLNTSFDLPRAADRSPACYGQPSLGRWRANHMGNNTDANRSEITTLPERVDRDAMPHKFDVDVEMKPNLGENIGLNPLHLKLIYRMENERLLCLLCVRRRERGSRMTLASFHAGTTHNKLIDHCTTEHPSECKKFILMRPDKLARLQDRILS